MSGSPAKRFIAKVKVMDSGCWTWVGAKTRGGYGHINIGGKMLRAHRYSYTIMFGPIPSGLELDHICRNRACVNPVHLEAVTTRENSLRGDSPAAKNAKKIYCPKGHTYDLVNTYLYKNMRHCRACRKRRMWEWEMARRENCR